jgi:hypothetical protein
MKVDVRWLVLALPVLALIASCSGDELPLCAESDWYRYRHRPAVLTGAPSFTASQIAPGDPLAIVVPVNEHTRSVSAGIRLEDDPDAGRWPNIALQVETDGDEIVQLPLEDTDLAPGIYFATISLEGGDAFEDRSEYSSAQGEASYIVSWWYHFEQPQRSCLTDIPVPTFKVVGD